MRRAADLTGVSSSLAWKIPSAGGANLAAWLVYQPGVHALWSYWVVSVVHLRPVEGTPEVRLSFPEASHEFIAVAHDPSCEHPDPDMPTALKLLSPPDLVHQVGGGVTDDQASAILEGAVKMVMTGRISFDSDYSESWKRVLTATVEHAVLGFHAKGSA